MSNFFSPGELKTLLPLDREEEEVHKMKVRALDGGGRFCEADVEITVEDVNDNAPLFTSDPYTFTVFENTEINTPVARLYASDLDTGWFSRILILESGKSKLVDFPLFSSSAQKNITTTLKRIQECVH